MHGGRCSPKAVTAYKVLLNPSIISESERNRIASELSEILNLDYNDVLTKVSDVTKQEIVLKRQVERDVVDTILSRKLGGGVYTAIDSKRYYPSGSLFSQLLGFTTIDRRGAGGAGAEIRQVPCGGRRADDHGS